MVSSTTLQLDKSSWPSSVPFALVKGSATPETQTLLAPNHTPHGSRYTVEHAYTLTSVSVINADIESMFWVSNCKSWQPCTVVINVCSGFQLG